MPVLFCNVSIFKSSKYSKVNHSLNSFFVGVLSVCCSWMIYDYLFPEWKKFPSVIICVINFYLGGFFYVLEIRIYSLVKMSADSSLCWQASRLQQKPRLTCELHVSLCISLFYREFLPSLTALNNTYPFISEQQRWHESSPCHWHFDQSGNFNYWFSSLNKFRLCAYCRLNVIAAETLKMHIFVESLAQPPKEYASLPPSGWCPGNWSTWSCDEHTLPASAGGEPGTGRKKQRIILML